MLQKGNQTIFLHLKIWTNHEVTILKINMERYLIIFIRLGCYLHYFTWAIFTDKNNNFYYRYRNWRLISLKHKSDVICLIFLLFTKTFYSLNVFKSFLVTKTTHANNFKTRHFKIRFTFLQKWSFMHDLDRTFKSDVISSYCCVFFLFLHRMYANFVH